MAFLPKAVYAVNFQDFPARAAKDFAGASTTGGVTVGVEPVTESDTQKQYFKVDFSKRNLLPVFVVIENGSQYSFILRREDIGVFAGTEQEATSGQLASGRSKTGEDIMLASAIAGSIGGMVIASMLMVKATEIRQNMIKKELRSSTLSPGQQSRGFVYVPLPSDPAKLAHLRMRVRLMKIGSDQPLDFNFPI
jgi:hypothetical protein